MQSVILRGFIGTEPTIAKFISVFLLNVVTISRNGAAFVKIAMRFPIDQVPCIENLVRSIENPLKFLEVTVRFLINPMRFPIAQALYSENFAAIPGIGTTTSKIGAAISINGAIVAILVRAISMNGVLTTGNQPAVTAIAPD